jgi:hypothetical protein
MTRKNKQTNKKWLSHGIGKFWKRLLHHARRQQVRAELRGIRGKEHAGLEGTVNWRAD